MIKFDGKRLIQEQKDPATGQIKTTIIREVNDNDQLVSVKLELLKI